MKMEVNTDTLKSDISSLKSYKSSLQTRFNALSDGMNSLNDSWEGSAKQAYMEQYQADENTVRDILTALDEFIQMLEYARSEYQTCERSVHSAVKAIKI
ncbi:MAG: WXG100 family type VII secretion target [Lachnospiraceae bacterium]|nr:WXG100 family type VII secretion target [Lachnospiraceae bacterium]